MQLRISAAFLGSLALAMPAVAHHSYSMFDSSKEVVLTGTVVEWQWTNPHMAIVLAAPDASGKIANYVLEGSSPAVLRERGWSRSIAKAGDKLVVRMFPLRDGSLGGQINSIVVNDSKTYGMTVVKP